jgi:hypothetical protein
MFVKHYDLKLILTSFVAPYLKSVMKTLTLLIKNNSMFGL